MAILIGIAKYTSEAQLPACGLDTEIVKEFAENPEPIIITQNSEAKMGVMDIYEYEKQKETMALLKLLALGRKEFQQSKFSHAEQFLDEMDD